MARILRRSAELGLLGPAAIEDHIERSAAFASAVGQEPEHALDLGAGGGVPGLVLAALAWRRCHVVLVDAGLRRTVFLRDAVRALDLEPRVAVVRGRAEEVGRDGGHRGHYDVVVARAFGPPAVVAECGAPLLDVGGRLVVSEPPGSPDLSRWPEPGLARLGLVPMFSIADGRRFVELRLVTPVSERFPRRTGVPAKRPLF